MTSYCEISESLASITSEVAVETVVMALNNVSMSSDVGLGLTPAVTTETASFSSVAYPESLAILSSLVTATSTVTHTLVFNTTCADGAMFASSLFAAFNVNATSAMTAASVMSYDVDVAPLVSAFSASSSAPAVSTTANQVSSANFEASSSTEIGLLGYLVSSATLSSVESATRVLNVTATNLATFTATAYPSAVVGFDSDVAISECVFSSSLFAQAAYASVLETAMYVFDEARFRDPHATAWVMNTESTAASWYTNYGFESVAQIQGGKTLAVGPDGLYELTGNTDDGVSIASRVMSGFTDLGDPHIKRLDEMYFGYTSSGRLALDVEVKESGHPISTYNLEQRDATAPRNSRVTPGKGLHGRYWRLTIRNLLGADFVISDASIDVAISNRRL